MHIFYLPEISGSEVHLSESESKHAIRVLRLSQGDLVQLVDGNGGYYEAQITQAQTKKCILSITAHQKEFGKRNFHLHLAIAPTKNIDRLEWFLEKCTEIGIDEITPIISEHSERKIIKPERLEKIIISAMKQSIKAYLPRLNPLDNFKEVIKKGIGQKFIAHCNPGEKQHLKNSINALEDVFILIGPEGDFSPDEVELAKQYGFRDISLGSSRLRTETAGVVACHIANLLNE